MAGKNQCYLCGGKLTEGYCPACGLDNMRIRRKHYHLNESVSVESINGDSRRTSAKCREKTKQTQTVRTFQSTGSQTVRSGQRPRNGRKLPVSAVPASGKVKIAVAVIGLAVVVTGFAAEYIPDKIRDIERDQRMSSFEFEEEYDDPYEFVKRKLPETGKHYETELGPGEYLIGVHLPEGAYTAVLLEGNGSFNVDDHENAIYLWQSFGTDEEYNEVERLEDIRLYKGARIMVGNNVLLQMSTENGQTEQMETMKNPLTEPVTLKADETATVGVGLPQGVYDISAPSGWAMLRCKVPDMDYGGEDYEKIYWLGEGERDCVYQNVYLMEEMEITADENQILLIPSEIIGSGDYEEYYLYYKYY